MTADNTDSRNGLIQETRDILQEIETFSGSGDFLSETEDQLQDEVRKKEMQGIVAPSLYYIDGYVDIHISPDKMLAKADFYPASQGRARLDAETVKNSLRKLSIEVGIDYGAIDDAIAKCDMGLIPIRDIIIARALDPKSNSLPFLAIEATYMTLIQTGNSGTANLDFHEISPFRTVKAGEVLARLEPGREGTPGRDILGTPIPFPTIAIDLRKPGKNTYMAGIELKASIAGRLIIDSDYFWVNEVLTLEGNVDYSTGNIKFPGDVFIAGEIKTGFKVNSGGSIYCSKLIDATEIIAVADISTNQGILGRETGIVRAGGSIETKFIEHCFVDATGPIHVLLSCLNSVIYTLDRLYTGPKGIISGGKVYARNGVKVAQIGNAAEVKTEIICGIDHRVQQKLLWIRDKNLVLTQRLAEIMRHQGAGVALTPAMADLRDEIQSSMGKLNDIAAILINNLDKNDKADVSVSGRIYPGTYVEICHVSFIVTKVMFHTRLYLDKRKGRIVAVNLTSDPLPIAALEPTLRSGQV